MLIECGFERNERQGIGKPFPKNHLHQQLGLIETSLLYKEYLECLEYFKCLKLKKKTI